MSKVCLPYAERNRSHILEVLKSVAPDSGSCLSIAEGTGQHVSYFAKHFQKLSFVPTEVDASQLESISAHCEGLENVRAPLALDVCARPWPFEDAEFSLAYNANMIHISPWACTEALFSGMGRVLRPGAHLVLYGPYKVDGAFTTTSNAEFDASLRARNEAWGIRDLGDVTRVAAEAGLDFVTKHDMPANNFCVVFRRRRLAE